MEKNNYYMISSTTIFSLVIFTLLGVESVKDPKADASIEIKKLKEGDEGYGASRSIVAKTEYAYKSPEEHYHGHGRGRGRYHDHYNGHHGNPGCRLIGQSCFVPPPQFGGFPNPDGCCPPATCSGYGQCNLDNPSPPPPPKAPEAPPKHPYQQGLVQKNGLLDVDKVPIVDGTLLSKTSVAH